MRFKIKPDNCYERLSRILKTAVSDETIEESVRDLKVLAGELEMAGNINGRG